MSSTDPNAGFDPATRRVLRHWLATLAYRFRQAVDDCPVAFGDFVAEEGVRSPRELVRHLTELSWLTRHCLSDFTVELPESLSWAEEIQRYHRSLVDLDSVLCGERLKIEGVESAVQGPLADALTHIGQINLLRRLAGVAASPHNYLRANIRAGELPFEGS